MATNICSNLEREIKLRISMMPHITKQSGIPFSGILLFGSSLLAFLGFSCGVSLGEYFTPWHTNSFSLYAQFVSQMLMTVSPSPP